MDLPAVPHPRPCTARFYLYVSSGLHTCICEQRATHRKHMCTALNKCREAVCLCVRESVIKWEREREREGERQSGKCNRGGEIEKERERMTHSEKEKEQSEKERERWRKTQRELTQESESKRETESDQHKITHTRFFSLFLAPKWTLTNRPESPAQQIRERVRLLSLYQFQFLFLESNYHAIMYRDLMSHTQTHTNVTHTHTHTHTHSHTRRCSHTHAHIMCAHKEMQRDNA